MNHPHIGSHHSIADQAHLWHFARTSGLPRGTFDQRHATWPLVLLAGIVAGMLAVIIGQWLF